MKLLYPVVCLTTLICFSLRAETSFDKLDNINGITLQSGKIESTRHYHGSIVHTFSSSLSTVKDIITSFSEKCNNDYENKRKYMDESIVCKYPSEDLVESLVVKDIGSGWSKGVHETERYLVARQIYRRGHYAHYDLVRISENFNSKNQKTVIIELDMLSDQEAQKYTKPAFKQESDFLTSSETYILTEIAPDKTQIVYSYEAHTDHWLLNKEISVPQVFASIGQNIMQKMKMLDENFSSAKREVASHK